MLKYSRGDTMAQQVVLLDLYPHRSNSLYYRYRMSMTFNTLDSWEWEHQPYFRHLKTYEDCMTLGIL